MPTQLKKFSDCIKFMKLKIVENADGDYLGGVNGGLGDEGMWDGDAIDGYVNFSDDEAEIGAVMRDTYVDPERDSDVDVTAVASHLLQYSDDDV
ncbi:hypothetical protein K435DRAFT_863888 [Dendrothele bispora CBS 962.96]|uniref:Uncharacterized protein n=1 Tax=Dendrothele bispora (strain CBS 962.96) TaxID=1314807 RepID=A0A4V4HEI1_DENBC|nr:hypothetical protein K435DRAFT_863888 [Dendrothele bispora CBS 962.96]